MVKCALAASFYKVQFSFCKHFGFLYKEIRHFILTYIKNNNLITNKKTTK